VVESAWGTANSGKPTLKSKLYTEASAGSLREIAQARNLWEKTESHISVILNALSQGRATHLLLCSRSELHVETRILLDSGRLREHFYQISSFNRMYPHCLPAHERKSIGQRRAGRKTLRQPTDRPQVLQSERLNAVFPAEEGVKDGLPEEEGISCWEEEEVGEQGQGNWLRDCTLPFKGSTVAKPRAPSNRTQTKEAQISK